MDLTQQVDTIFVAIVIKKEGYPGVQRAIKRQEVPRTPRQLSFVNA